MTWNWEPDTFATHWFNEANDQMPAPLRYRSRFPTLEELDAHQAAVRASCGTDERQRIDLLMHTVSRCDMRVEIIGSTVRHHQGDGTTHKQYRIVGAHTNHYAAVLFQTAMNGEFGSIRADLLSPENLPAAIVAAIPPCTPGTASPETFHLDDVKPPTAQPASYFADDHRGTEHSRFRRVMDRPTDGGGHAVLRLGDYHARPERHRFIQWRDITGDGRYVEQRNSTHLDIRPATPGKLTAIFTSWIDSAVARLRQDERQYR
ncbi:ESX secretion-associated protein EspG [Nocardia sp. NPDC058658]|uniref:ESX secretion-associated protein EspG n=1 Tax=Nocardia sp. NPDC058658 TaxID=3346580 RepID=UPI00364B4BD3